MPRQLNGVADISMYEGDIVELDPGPGWPKDCACRNTLSLSVMGERAAAAMAFIGR